MNVERVNCSIVIPIRLEVAWAIAGLSGTCHAVLRILAVDCCRAGSQGHPSRWKAQAIARLIGKSKSQVNAAVRTLIEHGFVERSSRRLLRLLWSVPPHMVEEVEVCLAGSVENS